MLYRSIFKCLVVFALCSDTALANVEHDSCLLNLMPCPQQVTLNDGYYVLNPNVNVYVEGMSAERMSATLSRTETHLSRLSNFYFAGFNVVKNKDRADVVIVVLDKMGNHPQLDEAAKLPRLGDDESYQLIINDAVISIQANSDFGAIHALTTLIQLVYGADKNIHKTHAEKAIQGLPMPKLQIIDKPRFPWRGLLIDSVRHFIPIHTIKRQLDGMAAAKLNVFHWHLTDDQGWRVESKRYPKLHQMASDNLYYTQQEIKDVVTYASLLGIRVMPEIDVPGHASAIAVAYPELMAKKMRYEMERQWGVFEPLLDVSNPNVYTFIDNLVAEFSLLFPDNYIHIGGDEVNPKQWLNNANIKRLMVKEKLADSEDLHHYFNKKIQSILTKHQRKMMGWDEIYHPDLPKEVVIQSWRGLESINKFANHGYQGVLSTGFYIDQPQSSAYHYRNDPLANIDSDSNKSKQFAPLGQTIMLGQNDKNRTWQLTIPRLKGSNVTGHFILIRKSNDGKEETASGYLKLNNNSFQKVTLLTPINDINNDQKNSKTLIFTVDSWMGPLRFELDLNSSDTSLSQSAMALNHRVFIGNAFYPLVADEVNHQTSQNIILAPRLKAENSQNILGGEATLWTELATQDNIDLRVWPRLFVIAERLWSAKQLTNINNMYQRLFFIDNYSQNIIGLKQNEQQRAGFSEFLGDKNSNDNLRALMVLAQLVEPAHYYTRHHIKYQQDKYHQLAELNSFVDFLPVESVELFKLNNLITAFQNGDNFALTSIKGVLKDWQNSEKQLKSFVVKNSKFAHLIGLMDDLVEFNQVAEQVIERCAGKTALTKNTSVQLNKRLNQLQEQQNEIVLAAIPLFQQLITGCQNTNQQMVIN